jgi:ribonuclease HI
VNRAAELLTPEEVLARFHEGPQTGVFTDGSCSPNPGPGGWGAVYVVEDAIVASAHGAAADTTNNRMELQALIGGVELVPAGTPATIYSDSQLVVKTMNEWAAGWARRGWKRKTGPIANLELVQQAYRALQQRPELNVAWLAGHAGYRWNEYADALANTWRREP